MALLSGALAGPRRAVLTLTIACFTVAAGVGIAALVRPGSFDLTDGQVLLTTVAIGSACVVALCYLAIVPTPFVWVASVGGVAALVALGTSLVLIWMSWGGRWETADDLLQVFGVATTWALTAAQSSLLLALAGRSARDWPALRGVLVTTQMCAVVVAGIVSGLVLARDVGDGGARALGVVGILDVLGTVVSVALARFGHRPARVDVTLPAELAARLDRRAAETGRSRDDLAAEAVTRLLDD